MPMNINGDFITRFGARLPVPYMEKITVRDETIEIQLSFYIKPPNTEEINSDFYDDYLDSLNELKVSIVGVDDSVKTSASDTSYDIATNPVEFHTKYGPIDILPTGTEIGRASCRKSV